ncbi:hypothetical protein L1887_19433 [Cichorium endivia]|nr:hypothetical protein L1887_19433 [Cichorium endivia]
MEEKDRLQKQVSHLVYENGLFRQRTRNTTLPTKDTSCESVVTSHLTQNLPQDASPAGQSRFIPFFVFLFNHIPSKILPLVLFSRLEAQFLVVSSVLWFVFWLSGTNLSPCFRDVTDSPSDGCVVYMVLPSKKYL